MTAVDIAFWGLICTIPFPLGRWANSTDQSKRFAALVPLLAAAVLLVTIAIQTGLPIGEEGQGERFLPIFILFGIGLVSILVFTALKPNLSSFRWLFVFLAFSPVFVQGIDKHPLGYGVFLAITLWFFVAEDRPRLNLLDLPMILLGVSGLGGIFFGVNRHAVLLNVGYHLGFLVLYLAFRSYLQQKNSERVIAHSAIITLTLIAVMSLVKLLHNAFVLNIDRPWNLKIWLAGNHPNALAAYLLFLIPLAVSAIWYLRSMSARIAVALSCIAGFVIMLLCRSRSALVGFIAVFGLATLILAGRLKRKWVSIIAVGIILALVGVTVLSVPNLKIESRAAKGYDSLWFRLFLWKLGWKSFLHYPLGVGLGNHFEVAGQIGADAYAWREYLITWLGWDRLGRHCHQFLTEFALTTGIFGIAAIIALVGVWLRRAGSVLSKGSPLAVAGWLSVAAFLITTLNDCPIYYPSNYLLLWLGAALMVTTNDTVANHKFPLPRWFVLPVWLLFALYPSALPAIGEDCIDRAEAGLNPYETALGKLNYLDPVPIRTLAFNRIRNSNLPMTIQALQRTLKREPRDPRALCLLGWLDLCLKPQEPPSGYFNRAIAEDPLGVLDQNQHVDSAIAELYGGNQEAAIKKLETALLCGSDLRTCPLWVEDQFKLNWQFDLSQLNSYLQGRFSLSPTLVPPPPQIAAIPLPAVLRGITERARALRDTDEDNANAMILKVVSYYWQTELARVGVELLDEFQLTPDLIHGEMSLPMVTITEGDPESLRAAGIQALSRGDAATAIRFFLQLRNSGMDDNRLKNSLAEAYLKNGDFRKAVSEYEKILRTTGDVPEIMVNVAICLRRMGNGSEAETKLLEVLKLDRGNSRALFNLGTLYLEADDTNKAIGYLKHCLHFDPQYLPAVFNLAVAYEGSGRAEEAVALYEEYLAKSRSRQYDSLGSEAEKRLRNLKQRR